jgi:hypothetical protein
MMIRSSIPCGRDKNTSSIVFSLIAKQGMESNNPRINRKKVARTQDKQSNHTYRSNSSSGLDGFCRCSFCELSLYSSFRSSLFILFLLRRLRISIIFPLAPAVKVNESLHAAPFSDFALHPCKVYRLEIRKVSIVSASGAQLEKAVSPSSRSRCIRLPTLRACHSVNCSPLTPR